MCTVEKNRGFLKNRWDELAGVISDQDKGIAHPPVEKPYNKEDKLINLVGLDRITLGGIRLIDVLKKRRSRRQFTQTSLTLEELSFLLWSTQGIEKILGDGVASFRTVPSAGARHAFETYLFISNVDGIEKGLYRYLPVEHKLLFVKSEERFGEKISEACCGQKFIAKAAVVFIWTTIPYRMEWRYSFAGHKAIAMDAGHLCQNLYLASEAIGAGTCAIGAYFQEQMDKLIDVDGEDEFVIYLAPVGKVD